MWDDTRRRILDPSSFVVFGLGFMLAPSGVAAVIRAFGTAFSVLSFR
jgi:hypothetical protein